MAYPFKKYNYLVAIDGVTQAGFSEISAGDITVEPIKYREGNYPKMTPGKLSGLVEYGNVTLKWGMSDNQDFYKWVTAVGEGKTERKKVTIQLMDDTNKEAKAEWVLDNAWPTKYTAPDFNATSNEVAFESIELAHEGLARTK